MNKKHVSLLAFLYLLAGMYSKSFAQGGCPPNIDFEQANLGYWEMYTGSCCPISANTLGIVSGRHDLVTGVATDEFGLFPVVAPSSGLYSLKLGNKQTGAQAERARYYIHIPNGLNNYVFIFRYAVVLEDPAHAAAEQPRFEVKAFDSATGSLIPCTYSNFVASATLPGFQVSTKQSDVLFKPWSVSSIDLSGFGGKTIAVDFATGDCSLGGHFGYAYIDMNCGIFQTYYSVNCNSPATMTLSGPPGFQVYEWRDANLGLIYGNTQSITIPTPNKDTKYALILKPYAGIGCPDTLYTQVVISRLNPMDDTTICINKGVTMNAGSNSADTPLTYLWTPTTGLSCSNCAHPTAQPGVTTKYFVTITDTANCVLKDSITINVANDVKAKIHSNITDSICQYYDIKLQDTSVNGPDVSYIWFVDTGNVLAGGGTKYITADWSTPGMKKIKLRVTNGYCDAYDSIYIYVKPTPLASFEVPHNTCLNKAVELNPMLQDGSYHWKIDEQSYLDTNYTKSIYLTWSTLGKKSIRLHMNGFNGCQSDYDSTVNVHEYPDATILYINTPLQNTAVCQGQEIELQATPGVDYTYEWSPTIFFRESNQSTVHANLEKSSFIYLKINSRWGCNVADTQYVTVQPCCDINTATAFTPNGDGRNDKLKIVTPGTKKIVTFIIQNRWGQKVYETNDGTQGWDGMYKGEKQESGTYFYYIKYMCDLDNKTMEKRGNFELLR